MSGGSILSEHRTGRRFPVNLPIEFELGDSARKHKGAARDMSAAGAYITAAAPFQVGSKVKFQIRVPGDLVGAKQDVDIECQGHVVRVDKAEPAKSQKANGEAPDGVACVIDTYEIVRPRAAAAGKKASR
jgi:hypothetical protein